MRVETESLAFEGPEPAGPEGRALRAAALPVIAETEALVLIARGQRDRSVLGGIISTWCARVEVHPRGLPLLLQTFNGWTVDGLPVTRATIEGLPLTSASEPWEALFEVWSRLGFFGRAIADGMVAADKAAREATPTSG